MSAGAPFRTAGRSAALVSVLLVGLGVALAVWPTSGAAQDTAVWPFASSAARSTAPPQPAVERPALPSPPAVSPKTRRPHAPRARVVTGQLVTVTAATSRSTVALVQRWARRGGSWSRVGAAMTARVGSAGLTRHPSEKLPATPIGSFSLTQAFGAAPNTGHRITELRYIHIRYGDTWGARPNRPRTYNRYYNCHCRGATLFALRHSLFRYGMVIDYNRAPVVPGAGSGFFLHVTNGRPTAGCVAVAARNVRMLLGWLRPGLHPRILIRVAGAPPA